MKKIVKLLGLVILFLTFLLFFLKNIDIETNYYLNKEAVLDDNAIQRGWIPNILPLNAYEISETHNIDTNEFHGRFKYLEKEEQSFLNNFKSTKNKLTWKYFKIIIDKKNNIVIFSSKGKEH